MSANTGPATQDATTGPDKRYAFPNLDMRLDVDFPALHCSKNFQNLLLIDNTTGEETPYRAYSINNHWDGCKHIGITIQKCFAQHCAAIANSIDQIKGELEKIRISVLYDRDPKGAMESTDELMAKARIPFARDLPKPTRYQI